MLEIREEKTKLFGGTRIPGCLYYMIVVLGVVVPPLIIVQLALNDNRLLSVIVFVFYCIYVEILVGP